jgi:DNA repair protein RadC
MVMYLNRANRVLGIFPTSVGGITGTVADPQLILSVALKTASTGIILEHNHPSGALKPSQSDIDLTIKIKEGGKLLDIKLLDHLILSPNEKEYYSFADEGMM